MNINEDQIERFFQDKCNAKEAEAVIAYLNEHPAIAEKYMDEKEWSTYKSDTRLHPVISQEMLSVVRKTTYGNTKKTNWLRYVAAASILIIVALGIKYWTNNKETPAIAKEVNKEVVPALQLVKNNMGSDEQIMLEDSSIIVLKANSELSYYQPFETNKRRLYLKGEALFKVAKNKQKPFTVYSNEIAITALGTEFKVVAFENLNTITVNLYKGKVVIKLADSSNKSSKDVFLLPGDEYSYNRTTAIGKQTNSNTKETKDNKVGLDKSSASNWFMFNNQNLAQVFEHLSEIFDVKIVYSKAEISRINFIGKIEKTDSLENILKDIALLNNLSITKQGNRYTVTKK